jgi:hypothetical protein
MDPAALDPVHQRPAERGSFLPQSRDRLGDLWVAEARSSLIRAVNHAAYSSVTLTLHATVASLFKATDSAVSPSYSKILPF